MNARALRRPALTCLAVLALLPAAPAALAEEPPVLEATVAPEGDLVDRGLSVQVEVTYTCREKGLHVYDFTELDLEQVTGRWLARGHGFTHDIVVCDGAVHVMTIEVETESGPLFRPGRAAFTGRSASCGDITGCSEALLDGTVRLRR